jgi:hypothetical protein
VPTTSRDLMASYGDGCDFDRLLAGRQTIASCWALAVLLILATGVPVAIEVTHAVARGIPAIATPCADHPPGEG